MMSWRFLSRAASVGVARRFYGCSEKPEYTFGDLGRNIMNNLNIDKHTEVDLMKKSNIENAVKYKENVYTPTLLQKYRELLNEDPFL